MFDPLNLPTPLWVIAPHPDDEALGCGGLLAHLSDEGREVWAMLVTDGGASHPHSAQFPRPKLAERRLAEWREGLSLLGIPAQQTRALGLPDGDLGGADPDTARQAITRALAAAPPCTLLLPWRRDPHPDHRACWRLFEPLLPQIPTVLEYTVWLPERGEARDWPRSDEGLVEWSFPITDELVDRKAQAIAAHCTQLGLITDDPTGFTLAPEMVARASKGPERYFVWQDAAPRLLL